MARTNLGSRFEIFAAGENLTDRTIEVSKTPTTTLADGITGRVGASAWDWRAQLPRPPHHPDRIEK